MTYKAGDTVRITHRRHGHCHAIGQVVTLESQLPDLGSWFTGKWLIDEDEFEPHPGGRPQPHTNGPLGGIGPDIPPNPYPHVGGVLGGAEIGAGGFLRGVSYGELVARLADSVGDAGPFLDGQESHHG